MSEEKRLVRERFRVACLERDKGRCRICATVVRDVDVNVHHITPREVMPKGGYVVENGITCCPRCHECCEAALQNESEVASALPMGFFRALSRAALYAVIGSSYAAAVEASKQL